MMNCVLDENTFALPGGLALQPNRTLSHAVLRPLTGRDEEWLARHRSSPSAVRVSWVLRQCLLALDDSPLTGDLVRRLLVGDRDYLMVQLRRITLGDRVQAVVVCPQCNQKMDVDLRLDDAPVQLRPQRQDTYELDISGRVVRFRLPNGADQEAVLFGENSAEALLDRCMIDDTANSLSEAEREAMIAEMERLAPQVDVELDLSCPECSHQFVLPFDTSAFFFDEVALKTDELLQEVHTLAFYYHWSESEILSLDRRKRRAYLALLHEALRQE
jgi:hypothetical protein